MPVFRSAHWKRRNAATQSMRANLKKNALFLGTHSPTKLQLRRCMAKNEPVLVLPTGRTSAKTPYVTEESTPRSPDFGAVRCDSGFNAPMSEWLAPSEWGVPVCIFAPRFSLSFKGHPSAKANSTQVSCSSQ